MLKAPKPHTFISFAAVLFFVFFHIFTIKVRGGGISVSWSYCPTSSAALNSATLSLLSCSCCGEPPPSAGGPRLRLRLPAHQATERGPAKQRAARRQARQVGGEEGRRDGSCGLGLARRKQQRRQPGQLTCNPTTTTTTTFSTLHSLLLVFFLLLVLLPLTPPPLLHPSQVPNGENSISFFTFCQMASK